MWLIGHGRGDSFPICSEVARFIFAKAQRTMHCALRELICRRSNRRFRLTFWGSPVLILLRLNDVLTDEFFGLRRDTNSVLVVVEIEG
jgi:hypothetical protein